MDTQRPFGIPPLKGNAVADVAIYAIFLAAQIALALGFLRKWNWPIFFGTLAFLFLELLGSIAYLKLHFHPIVGGWYTLWVFSWTAAPIFWIAALHFCTQRALQSANFEIESNRFYWPSSPRFLVISLGIDLLALLFAIIGAAYMGAKFSNSATTSPQPAFDLMVVSMVVQACSVMISLFATATIMLSFSKQRYGLRFASAAVKTTKDQCPNNVPPTGRPSPRPGLLLAYLASLLFVEVIVFVFAIIRSVDVAGGLTGPLRWPLLGGVETIILFIAILVMIVLHPAVILPRVQLRCPLSQ